MNPRAASGIGSSGVILFSHFQSRRVFMIRKGIFPVLVLFAIMLWPLLGLSSASEDRPREISVAGTPAIDAASVGDAQNMLTGKTLECAKTEATPMLCQCRFPDEMGLLRTAVDRALRRHPEWRDAIVNYRENGQPAAPVSFPAITERLEECR